MKFKKIDSDFESCEQHYENTLCNECPYTNCFMNGNVSRDFECQFEKEIKNKKTKNGMLDDAMSLLMNHDQHEDESWKKDYEELCKRYEKQL